MVLIALVGVVNAWTWLLLVAPGCAELCAGLHDGIVQGTGDAPFRYRVLTAAIVDLLPGDVVAQYAAGHILLLPIIFGVIWLWMRERSGRAAAAMTLLVLTVYGSVWFRSYSIALYSWVELAFVAAAGLYLARRRGDGWYVLLVMVGTLNRETTGMMMVLMAAAYGEWRGAGFAAAGAGAVFVGLRLWLGVAAPMLTLEDIARINLSEEYLLAAGWYVFLLLPILLLAARGWRRVDALARRTLIMCAAIYLPLMLVYGVWAETRLLLPILLLAMPMVWRGVDDAPLG